MTRINSPAKLIESLSWYMLPSDGAMHALKGDHCRVIAHVVRMLCGAHETLSAAQEARAIIGDYLQIADVIEGLTTYGTSQQRYEAAVALRRYRDPMSGRPFGPLKYLIDAGAVNESTGELVGSDELVIPVGELQEVARKHVGSSLHRGWLDARMVTFGWRRIALDGHGQPGRVGRQHLVHVTG